MSWFRGRHCHCSCFGVYASLECRTHDTQERWQLLLPGQTVKLFGGSHGPSCALSHDRAHVPSPDHDSSPPMTCHVAGPYLSYLSATLPIGCHTLLWLHFAQPHFWLVVLILIIHHTSGWTPHFPLVILTLPQPHLWLAPTLILPFSIYPYCCQAWTNVVCAPWSMRTLVAI